MEHLLQIKVGGRGIATGFEPQWILMKSTSNLGDWIINDSVRGIDGGAGSGAASLMPNETSSNKSRYMMTTSSNGFTINGAYNYQTFIYVAIAAPVVRNLTQEEVNASKLLFETTDYRKCKHICDLTARGAELRASLQAAGYTTSEIDNLLDLTSIPIALNGYYPLYTTEAEADAAGNGSSHAHTVDSVVYYMPDGGTAIYHGTYGS